MPVNYDTTTKAARMNAVATSIGASGKFKLLSSTDQILATFTLAETAGTVAGPVLTFSDANGAAAGILNTTASVAGTATKAVITTSADVTIVSGLVAGTDFTLDNPTFTFGQAITINSATLTHAA